MTASVTLYETIRQIVEQELRRVRTAELAIVQEQHPHASESDKDNYACTVVLRNTELVLRQVPVATGRIGFANIPNVGDLVLVQFIGGDINAPVITGRLYNDEDRPPVNDDGQSILHLPLGASDSDAVHIDLSSGDDRQLRLRLGDAITIDLHDDDPVVKVEVAGGKATLRIDRDGAVTIESQSDIELKGNAIKIEAQGELDLNGATVNIQGTTVNIN